MDKTELVNLVYDRSAELTLENPSYLALVRQYTFDEVEKDVAGVGDITSDALIGKGAVQAKIIVKEDGVISGLDEVKFFFHEAGLAVECGLSSGDVVRKGQEAMLIEGEAKVILCCERAALNLLSRMSGIASYAHRLSKMLDAGDASIAATRKTLWGLLDKKAVADGGCLTHRLNLSDMVLVKDNHLAFLQKDFRMMFERFAGTDSRAIEVEVESYEDAGALIEVYHDMAIKLPLVVMLDNIPPANLARTVETFSAENVLFEASGGIREENLKEYASSGVDVVSMGALTGCTSGLDFSLQFA